VRVDGLFGQQQTMVEGAESYIHGDGQVGVSAHLTPRATGYQDVEHRLPSLAEEGLSIELAE
jgi:hypothetical protein